jgi:hypothetical protein
MPEQDLPPIEPGRGRLRYDKTRRTIVAEERQMPDYLYDPDDWEVTYHWSDRDEAAECADLRQIGEIKEFGTLIEGPKVFLAVVPTEWDDDGSPAAWKDQWFNSEAEAKAAIAREKPTVNA